MAIFRGFSGTPKFVANLALGTGAGTITNTSFVDVPLSVPGFLTDMIPKVNLPSLEAGVAPIAAWCIANGTVIIRLHNISGGSVTPSTSQQVNILGL